jgi:hypothetical protein
LLVTAMMTVSAMHEDVHQRAGEQRQPNQQAQDMGLMLGEQQRALKDMPSCTEGPRPECSCIDIMQPPAQEPSF